MEMNCSDIDGLVRNIDILLSRDGYVSTSDMKMIVNLILAVKNCSEGGLEFNKLVSKNYMDEQVVTIPSNSFNSCSLTVTKGSVEYSGIILPAGSVKNIEFTALNSEPFEFKLTKGSNVLVEYLTVDDIEI